MRALVYLSSFSLLGGCRPEAEQPRTPRSRSLSVTAEPTPDAPDDARIAQAVWGADDAGQPVRVSVGKGGYGYRDAETGAVVLAEEHWRTQPFNVHGIGDIVLNDVSSPAANSPSWDVSRFARVNRRGEIVEFAYFFDNGHDYYEQGLARFVQGGKVGFSTPAGEHVIAAQYDWASSFRSGPAIVCVGCVEVLARPEAPEHRLEVTGGKWGAIDTTGAVVVPLEHDGPEAVSAALPSP